MTTYAFRARNPEGSLIEGHRAAADLAALRRLLRGEGLFLVGAREKKSDRPVVVRRPPGKELALFTFHLNGVVEAGIPLLAGLEDLSRETKDRSLRYAAGRAVESLQAGDTLSQALARHPRVFEPLYIRMIEAGEATGRLGEVTSRLVDLLEWREEVRGKVQELVRYPTTILIALAGLVTLLLTFVFPRFQPIFEAVDFPMPWPTRVLLALSSLLRTQWMFLAAGAAVAFALVKFAARSELLLQWRDASMLRLPVVGPFVKLLNYGRVTKFLSSFVDAGIPIPAALELTANITSNRKVAQSLRRAREAVLAGGTLSASLRETGVFPTMIIRVVVLGEESGGLVRSLEKAASLFDREVPARMKAFLGAMNPIITFLMGGVLLFVVLGVMLPIYSLLQAIGPGAH